LEEAAATDRRLEICHVCPAESPLATRTGPVPLGLLELADPPLARAVAAAKTGLGGNRVTLSVHTGRVDHALVRTSAHADLLVVAAGGRTTHQVATHALCPVVVVRPDTSSWHGPFAGHVVVGVDGSPPARAALAFGFGYAAAHRRPLAAVHVTPYDGHDFWVDDQMLETHLTEEPGTLAMLAGAVEPWTHEYPLVVVKRAVYADRPVAGLMRAAAGATLLVVGDRGRGLITRAVLGSVADGVIDHATGTVAVAHTHDTSMALIAGSEPVGGCAVAGG
jgi:nucleotide-binding universal stress UspA family protein